MGGSERVDGDDGSACLHLLRKEKEFFPREGLW